jgi:hypothetical protein
MIERLASKAADRRDFLRHCGVNGLLLAVSVQGGAAGQRNFPLLPGAEAVTIVQEQVRRIVFGQRTKATASSTSRTTLFTDDVAAA